MNEDFGSNQASTGSMGPVIGSARRARRPAEIGIGQAENGWIISVSSPDGGILQYVARDIQQATALIETLAKDLEEREVHI